MALTEANKNKICQILEITPLNLGDQLTYVGARFTAQCQTDVETQIALWDAGAGNKTSRIFPMERNMGFKTDPDAARNQIRTRIAMLLEAPQWASSGNYLARG